MKADELETIIEAAS